jgi:hypothetical protein
LTDGIARFLGSRLNIFVARPSEYDGAAIRRSSFVGSLAAAGFIDPTQTVHVAFTSLNLAKKKKKNAPV